MRRPRSHPNPGTPALHRLNRTEYANVIRDLLALDVDVAALLPQDDATDGFDNIADALGTSPSLIQGYVSAAMKISRRAVGDRTLIPSQVTYNAPGGLSQDKHIEGLPLGTRGGMLIQHTFPMDAEYDFNVGGAAGGVDFTIDGQKIDVRNTRNFRVPCQRWSAYARRRCCGSDSRGRCGRCVFGLPGQFRVHAGWRRQQHRDQWPGECYGPGRYAKPPPHLRLPSRECH